MTQSELRRDTGVVFENAAGVRQTERHAREEESGRPPGQREHSRDVGVKFGKTETPPATNDRRQAASDPKRSATRDRDTGVSFENTGSEMPPETITRRDTEPPAAQARGRSHDAGLVFENVKSAEEPKHAATPTGSISGLLVSMAGLGGAATRFTLHQMRNAAHLMTDPFHAAGHLQHSIDEFSAALNKSMEEPQSHEDKHTF